MGEVKFLAVIGEDRVIRLPADAPLPGGRVEVTVREAVATTEDEEAEMDSLRDLLLSLAAESERLAPLLPPDMAENHDHYAHGKPLP